MQRNKIALVILFTLVSTACGVFFFLRSKGGEKSKTNSSFKPDKEIRLVATNYSFTPNIITVKKGERVRLKLYSKQGTHGISVPELNIIEYMPEGEEVTADFIPSKVGEFRFACSIYCGNGHGEMIGSIIVTE